MRDDHLATHGTRLFFYIGSIGSGGAERVIVNLANSFSRRGYRVGLVTDLELADEYFLEPAIHRVILDADGPRRQFVGRTWSRIMRLRKIVQEYRPAALVSFLPEPNFRSLLATLGLSTRTIISVRNHPHHEYRRLGYRFLARLLYPLASGSVFQTTDAQKYFSKRVRRKSTIILNQVDERFFRRSVDPAACDIVTVGRLTEQKNHSMTIKAFARIAHEYPECILRIYGEGADRVNLEQLTNSLGLQDRVKFMGLKSDMAEELCSARAFVLSSNYEGLPNAVMEAMAVGLPVVSTDCPVGGPRMLLRGGYGLLVPVGSIPELTVALKSLLGNLQYARQLGASARARSIMFEPRSVIKHWDSYIIGVL